MGGARVEVGWRSGEGLDRAGTREQVSALTAHSEHMHRLNGKGTCLRVWQPRRAVGAWLVIW